MTFDTVRCRPYVESGLIMRSILRRGIRPSGNETRRGSALCSSRQWQWSGEKASTPSTMNALHSRRNVCDSIVAYDLYPSRS